MSQNNATTSAVASAGPYPVAMKGEEKKDEKPAELDVNREEKKKGGDGKENNTNGRLAAADIVKEDEKGGNFGDGKENKHGQGKEKIVVGTTGGDGKENKHGEVKEEMVVVTTTSTDDDEDDDDSESGDVIGDSPQFSYSMEDLEEIAKNLTKLLDDIDAKKAAAAAGGNNTAGADDADAGASSSKIILFDIVSRVRDLYEDDGDVGQGRESFSSIVSMLVRYRNKLAELAGKYAEGRGINFDAIDRHVVHYYMEREDEAKNPSWKRRKYRFCDDVSIDDVRDLHTWCELATIAYCTDDAEMRSKLDDHAHLPCDLVFSQVDGKPGRPANYVAVAKEQSMFSWSLNVVLAVRGPVRMSDAVKDVLQDAVPYQKGMAHSYVVRSGKYIFKKHNPLMQTLLKHFKRSRIKLTLVGHGLGAGAATVAAMEWNKNFNHRVDARVVGFGCPAMLSQRLVQKSRKYVTTVINDCDVVPRLSGPTVANLFLKLASFDWTTYARRDVDNAAKELHRIHPQLFTSELVGRMQAAAGNVLDGASRTLEASNNKREDEQLRQQQEQVLKLWNSDSDKKKKNEDDDKKKKKDEESDEMDMDVRPVPVELFPPGKCVYFWRDGNGRSASEVPNAFFDEIDVCRRMLDDHPYQNGYEQAFLEIMRQYVGDHHFRFDADEDDLEKNKTKKSAFSSFVHTMTVITTVYMFLIHKCISSTASLFVPSSWSSDKKSKK